MLRFWLPAIIIAIVLSYFFQFKDIPQQTTKPHSYPLFKGATLSAREVLEAASSQDLKISKVRVLIDNDAAFDSKIEALQNAKAGETIRMSYSLSSQDESSAVFITALLAAAARGVHVRLLTNMSANSAQLDPLSLLEDQSRGLIQVKLYGHGDGPTEKKLSNQKVLVVENHFVQIGSRDIGNSFHLKTGTILKRPESLHTDLSVELTGGGDAIVKAFDRLWNFETKTLPLKKARNLSSKELTSLPGRISKIQKNLAAGVQTYNAKYLPKKSYKLSWRAEEKYADEILPQDIENLLLAYIENLPFEKDTLKEDEKNGKYISKLWLQGLENACAVAVKESKEKRVIVHAPSSLLPFPLFEGFKKMADGTWDCRRVRVTILTTGPETPEQKHTDVSIHHQIAELLQATESNKKSETPNSPSRNASFEYFEYLKEAQIVLQSNVMILGDDATIGSAAADAHSNSKDTENAFFLRGAKNFVKEYIAFVDAITQDSQKTRNLTSRLISVAPQEQPKEFE